MTTAAPLAARAVATLPVAQGLSRKTAKAGSRVETGVALSTATVTTASAAEAVAAERPAWPGAAYLSWAFRRIVAYAVRAVVLRARIPIVAVLRSTQAPVVRALVSMRARVLVVTETAAADFTAGNIARGDLPGAFPQTTNATDGISRAARRAVRKTAFQRLDRYEDQILRARVARWGFRIIR